MAGTADDRDECQRQPGNARPGEGEREWCRGVHTMVVRAVPIPGPLDGGSHPGRTTVAIV
jgi:hypothetical protein